MAMNWQRVAVQAVTSGVRAALRSVTRPTSTPRRATGTGARRRADRRPAPVTARAPYPGDLTGRATLEYSPHDDGRADPGEIVWAWVPFEEDHGRGKDRPTLVVGRDGDWLLALMLTSKDHDRDAADEARQGRHWLDIGSGDWDPKRRPSEVRTDRILRLDPQAIRREGGRLDRERFGQVAAEVRRVKRW